MGLEIFFIYRTITCKTANLPFQVSARPFLRNDSQTRDKIMHHHFCEKVFMLFWNANGSACYWLIWNRGKYILVSKQLSKEEFLPYDIFIDWRSFFLPSFQKVIFFFHQDITATLGKALLWQKNCVIFCTLESSIVYMYKNIQRIYDIKVFAYILYGQSTYTSAFVNDFTSLVISHSYFFFCQIYIQ